LELLVSLSSENLKHHDSTSRTFALDRLAPIFHELFDAIGNFLLGFALNAISFWHNSTPENTP